MKEALVEVGSLKVGVRFINKESSADDMALIIKSQGELHYMTNKLVYSGKNYSIEIKIASNESSRKNNHCRFK